MHSLIRYSRSFVSYNNIIISESDFVGAPITITIPRPGGGTNRQVMLEVPFIDDNINEHEETFVGYIEIESAIDESILTFARTATQLIINDNDGMCVSSTVEPKSIMTNS